VNEAGKRFWFLEGSRGGENVGVSGVSEKTVVGTWCKVWPISKKMVERERVHE